MKESLKRDVNKTYLVFEEDQENWEESFEISMLEKNPSQVFLPVQVLWVDRKKQYLYDISSKQSLEDYSEYQKLNEWMLRRILEKIMEGIHGAKDYLLDPSCISLEMKYIYIQDFQEVYFLYIPWKPREISYSFRLFWEEILGKIDYEDIKGARLAYSIYQKICENKKSILEVIREELEEKQEAAFEDPNNVPDLETKDESIEKPEKIGIFQRILRFFLKKEKTEEIKEPESEIPWEQMEWMPQEEEEIYTEKPVQSQETMILSGKAEQFSSKYIWKLRPLVPGYEEFVLQEGSFLVGKKQEAVDGWIDKDTISRIHSRFFSKEGHLYVGDANSTNGTYVNGKMIPPGEDIEIFSGDRVLFADVGYECYNVL